MTNAITPKIRQRGVSLPELMIGITIGLLVAVAAVGSLVYTKVSSTAVGDSSRLQQDASNAMRIIGHGLRQIGARRIQDASGGNVIFNPNYQGLPPPLSSIALSGTDGTSNGTDTLLISYDIDPTIDARDCLGQTPSGAAIIGTFSVTAGELRCEGSTVNAAPQAIVQGVEDFQVWYGVRTPAGFQYVAAGAVPSWDLVESVQVCLRLVGEVQGNPTVAADTPGCLPGQVIASDGRIRRVFRQVFNMRNAGL